MLSRKGLIFLALGIGLVVLGFMSGFGIVTIALVIVIGAVLTRSLWWAPLARSNRAILILCVFALLIEVFWFLILWNFLAEVWWP